MWLEWLRDIFGQATDANSEPKIRNAARAFLLYILGYTLFTDKSGTLVPVTYLQLLMDLDVGHTYALGVDALTYLYR